MESKVDQLVDRIYQDGLQKVKNEAEEIKSNARKEADLILEEAQLQAKKILKEAEAKAAQKKESVEADLKLAANQALSNLKRNISNIINNKIFQQDIDKAGLDVEFIEKCIISMISNSPDNDFTFILPETIAEELKNRLLPSIKAGLQNISIEIGNLKSGFVVKFIDQGFQVDFSEEALYQYFCGFLSKNTQSIFNNTQ